MAMCSVSYLKSLHEKNEFISFILVAALAPYFNTVDITVALGFLGVR